MKIAPAHMNKLFGAILTFTMSVSALALSAHAEDVVTKATMPDAATMAAAMSVPAAETLSGNYLAGRFAQGQQDWTAAQSYMNSVIDFDPENTLLEQLEDLKVMDGGYIEPGTLIGEGLATAVNRIRKGNNKTKVIILLTDGKEDAPPTRIIDPQMALEIAKANGVKVYCIGLGVSEFTEEQMASGVRNFLDEDLLKRIANETGGRYYHAVDKNSLQAIYSQIDKLEKTRVEIIHYKQVEEMFLPLVLAALVLSFLEILLRYTVFKGFP